MKSCRPSLVFLILYLNCSFREANFTGFSFQKRLQSVINLLVSVSESRDSSSLGILVLKFDGWVEKAGDGSSNEAFKRP